MDHLQRSSDHATVHSAVVNALQLIWNLHIQRQRVVGKACMLCLSRRTTQNARLLVAIPVLHRGFHSRVHWERLGRNVLARCLERFDSSSMRLGEVVLHQAESHVISTAYAIQRAKPQQIDLLVDLGNVFVVLHDLRNKRAVCQRQELCADCARLILHSYRKNAKQRTDQNPISVKQTPIICTLPFPQ